MEMMIAQILQGFPKIMHIIQWVMNCYRNVKRLKKQLPISSYARPAWDLNVLGKAGFSKFGIDLEISSRIYIEKDEFYNPTPLFMLCSRKKI